MENIDANTTPFVHKTKEELREMLKTPEAGRFFAKIRQERKRAKKRAKLQAFRVKRWMNGKSQNDIDTMINRLIARNNDNEYQMKYRNKSQAAPASPILSAIFDFIQVYGKRVLPQRGPFSNERWQYENYIFQVTQGQGVAYSLYKDGIQIIVIS